MSAGRSRADLLRFLDWMAEKGLLPANTASSRKASSNKVLALLSEEEADDVTSIDVDDLIHRFGTKFGQQYNPVSLRSYKSRLNSALEDFRAYCDNPVGFRPSGRMQQRARPKQEGGPPSEGRDATPQSSVREPSPPAPAAHVLPISIRANLTVQIGNLPHDLTEGEARRIANVILAYAIPSN